MKEIDKILELLQAGDKSGLKLLFHHLYKPLTLYAMTYLPQQEEAEDVVQDVFIKFWEGNHFNKVKNYLQSYLYKSVRNRCLNVMSEKRTVRINPMDGIRNIAESENPDMTDWNRRIDQLYDAIDSLPDRTRDVFKAIVLEEKRYKEVAEQYQISVNTVKTLFSRALSTLRSTLDEKTFTILLFFI